MTEIAGVPERFTELPGVEMQPPPIEWLPDTTKLIADAVASLGEDQGALTWIATERGVNLALVHKLNSHIHILGYVGKSWGKPLEAGLVGRIRW